MEFHPHGLIASGFAASSGCPESLGRSDRRWAMSAGAPPSESQHPRPQKAFSKTDPMTSCLASSPTLDLLDISSRGLVFYENRALERRFQTTPLPLVPQGAGARDVSAPAEDRDPVWSSYIKGWRAIRNMFSRTVFVAYGRSLMSLVVWWSKRYNVFWYVGNSWIRKGPKLWPKPAIAAPVPPGATEKVGWHAAGDVRGELLGEGFQGWQSRASLQEPSAGGGFASRG